MMRYYFGIAALVVVIFLWLGIIGPFLMSAPSDFAVVMFPVGSVILVPIVIYYLKWLFTPLFRKE